MIKCLCTIFRLTITMFKNENICSVEIEKFCCIETRLWEPTFPDIRGRLCRDRGDKSRGLPHLRLGIRVNIRLTNILVTINIRYKHKAYKMILVSSTKSTSGVNQT